MFSLPKSFLMLLTELEVNLYMIWPLLFSPNFSATFPFIYYASAIVAFFLFFKCSKLDAATGLLH